MPCVCLRYEKALCHHAQHVSNRAIIPRPTLRQRDPSWLKGVGRWRWRRELSR